MSVAFAAYIDVVALEELYEDLGHSNITIQIKSSIGIFILVDVGF
jgi:hypothetical protein